jgi:hypothetical protein
VADDAGLVIISVTDPADPAIVGSLPTYSRAVSVAVSGRYCFVGEQYYGVIDVVDCLDPSAPSIVTTISSIHVPWDLALSGNLLLTADDQWGVVIHDVADPESRGSAIARREIRRRSARPGRSSWSGREAGHNRGLQ